MAAARGTGQPQRDPRSSHSCRLGLLGADPGVRVRAGTGVVDIQTDSGRSVGLDLQQSRSNKTKTWPHSGFSGLRRIVSHTLQ